MSEVATIITRLMEIKEQQDVLENEASALWRAFYQIADRLAGEGKPYRYLEEEQGLVIGRIIAISETVDPAKLEKALTHQQWLSVTRETRSLDQARLEVELDKEHIAKDLVEPCIARKPTARKFGPRKASKDELADLAEQREKEAR